MREWGEEVEEQPDALKRTAAGKAAIATFQQTKKYLHPFYRMLHTRVRPLAHLVRGYAAHSLRTCHSMWCRPCSRSAGSSTCASTSRRTTRTSA